MTLLSSGHCANRFSGDLIHRGRVWIPKCRSSILCSCRKLPSFLAFAVFFLRPEAVLGCVSLCIGSHAARSQHLTSYSQNRLDLAHRDQPIKEGHVHLSAPHIYGSVLEALELRNDAAFSFLNAGSGTCYLTCIAASILGPRSVHYCVEVHEDVVQHAKESIASWKENYAPAQKMCNIDVFHGNALELDTTKGECALGFDRIYIGASIDKQHLPKFKMLLKPGGILVGPGKLLCLWFRWSLAEIVRDLRSDKRKSVPFDSLS